MSIPVVTGFFESRTSSIQYVVADPQTKHAAIIDPVLDFDPKSGDTDTRLADELLGYIAVRATLWSGSWTHTRTRIISRQLAI